MRPSRVQRHLARVHDVARLLVAEEHFRARADPLHRAAELLRREQQRAVFRIGVEAHAEAAADLLGHHAHLLRRHAEHRRQLPAHRPDALRGGVQEVHVLRRIVGTHRRARLHRVADHARVVGAQLHHARRPARTRPRSRRRRRRRSRAPGCRARRRAAAARPSASASARSVTAGSSSYSTTTASAASCACAAVSATISATGSPTWRTTSLRERLAQRGRCSEPSRHLNGAAAGIGFRPAASDVLAGEHRDDAGHRQRRGGVDRSDLACGRSDRRKWP